MDRINSVIRLLEHSDHGAIKDKFMDVNDRWN